MQKNGIVPCGYLWHNGLEILVGRSIMERYRASVFYDEESVKQLDATLQKTFHFGRQFILLILCFVLLGVGIRLGIQTTFGLIAILSGCLIAPYAAGYVFPGAAARSSLEAVKGKKFLMDYSFRSSDFVCIFGRNETVYQYRDIIRLVDHNEYLYLCISQKQACMLKKSTVVPEDLEAFKGFIAKKAGLEWTRQPSLLNLSLRTIRFNRRNTRQS